MSPKRAPLPDIPLPSTRRQIDLAGGRLRVWWLDPYAGKIADDPRLVEDVRLLYLFRDGFQDPLNRVTMGVRSFVKSEGAAILVAQRLKRLPTIVYKLARFPKMELTRMQDIAGCRAILPSDAHVQAVVRRIRHRGWNMRRVNDYTAEPKATGYRAVHVVVQRRGRLVEIQLRTPRQQRWAAEVDRAAGQVGLGLKDGNGPDELVRGFAELATRIAQAGDSAAVEEELDQEFVAIREKVRGYAATK